MFYVHRDVELRLVPELEHVSVGHIGWALDRHLRRLGLDRH